MTRAALNIREASAYLGLGETSRWLDTAPIPRVDMRLPGAGRPVWRWLLRDLDAFLDERRVEPGAVNPLNY